MRRVVFGLAFLISVGFVACRQEDEVTRSPSTQESDTSGKSKVTGGSTTQLSQSTSQTDTNLDPLIKLTPLTVPADWKAAVTERYPKYLEAAQKGEPMPEFDMQHKRLSQVEKEYPTNSVNARGIILTDISEIETPAVAAGLGRLFNVETNVDLKLRILACLRRMEGLEQQKLLTFTAATKSELPLSVRKCGINYLSELKEPSAKALLQSLIKDPDPVIRQEAEDRLHELK